MPRALARVALTIGALLLLAVALVVARTSRPPPVQDLPLPPGEVALDTPEGQALLAGALQADHAALLAALQTQEKGSWCGVASSVTVLNALRDPDLTQAGLFTPEASAVRGRWRVTLTGMPLDVLAGQLAAHGLSATAQHASQATLQGFLAEARRNLATPGDYLIVNYDRAAVSEEGSGHISPVSALSADGAALLLLDTSSYKYPPHWVPVDQMFAAMQGTDPDGGLSRGWVVVSEGPAGR